MEKKEIKRVLERIYRFLKDNKGRLYVDDCETVTLYEGMSEIIEQELDKAREEGKKEALKEVSSKIEEIYKATIPYGLYSPSEMYPLYERFTYAMQKYYIKMTSKLKDNK